ncbi:hypothetical protein [Companilactobacillus sp.]|jgi:hypothetical protein|uniref:hypothetical protein n=1 Tax=Companilactobacillus sp. TaxID=2767905 RepID=UPI0025C0B9BC|nr:hypothetical protein [Companilactobacillus sp.]MCH4009559.1 hypothetical protein [Companilactobacillus sp.]MCH4052765.1 hypothetical protein [Companilactobacillus sp.]MCH4077501.1 hypothetical protein [Companilactobacillus sp.]MCH4126077.1 hypothetical protein [Companilactobacillus sp.]MCI1311785.1 hypothetical protein [Companilactobacillus sp.]
MKFNKVLLSSSLAITAALAGISIAQGSAHAETTTDNSADVEQVASTQASAQADAASTQATSNDSAEITSTTAVNTDQAATTDQTNETAQVSATQASADQPAVQASTDDATTESVIPSTPQGIFADVVGNHIVAPVTETALAAVKPISSIYAGGSGLVNPSSNVAGRVTKDLQNAGINIVGDTLGALPKKILQDIQPYDLTANNVAGVYGLVTGRNDTIPNKVGQDVTDRINGVSTDEDVPDTTPVDNTPVVSYSNESSVGTVTTNKLAPLFTANGDQASRSLAAGSDWYTDILRTNNATGQQYFRVSTNEYVRAQDVTFN